MKKRTAKQKKLLRLIPFFVLIAVSMVLITIPIIYYSLTPSTIGGDKDAHGCLTAAGYSWNATDSMCLREWTKTYCTEKSRNAGACIEIYTPVCGLPVKQTFSNSCFACLNTDVKYYVPGKCP